MHYHALARVLGGHQVWTNLAFEQLVSEILSHFAILCDLSGQRPNCYYETGFAHALGRELILTLRGGEKAHFDLQSHRFIEWSTDKEVVDKLRQIRRDPTAGCCHKIRLESSASTRLSEYREAW